MKKASIALLLCAAVLLSACSVGTSVEDMLLAPALTEDQIAVKEALEKHANAAIVLKYPIDGARRAPIQFIDLDGGGDSEVVVFYAVEDAAPLARMAVLKKDDSGWRVAESVEGKEANVETVNFNRLAGSDGMFILVEWSSVNKQSKYLSAYRFENGKINTGIEDAVYDYLVYDLDSDDIDEIVYITLANGLFILQYADVSDSFVVAPVRVVLSEYMTGCNALTAGLLADGTPAVFIDEIIGRQEETETRYQMTEVFVLSDARLIAAPVSDGDIALVSTRPLSGPTCARLYKDVDYGGASKMMYIPSVSKPIDIAIAREDIWTYWYTIRDNELSYELATHVDTTYEFALGVPDEWLAAFYVYHTEATPYQWVIVNDDDYAILTLRILLPGESAAGLGEEYTLVGQTSTYKYYVKCDGSAEEIQFIQQNFIIL